MCLVFCIGSASYAAVDEFTGYINSAADTNQTMNVRWKALLMAAGLATNQQIDSIKIFTQKEEWYMRNAALVALKKVDFQVALEEARKLLQDKALVVRSAAVDVMAENLIEQDKQLLIQELNKPYNFNKKSSLWIRKQIVEKISAIAGQADRSFFAKNLFDSDKEVAEVSARALEKITGRQVDDVKFVEKWKSIAKENNWL
jgi:HEAT repeat protein